MPQPHADYARLAELVVAPEVRPADRVRLSRRLEEGRRVEALAEAFRARLYRMLDDPADAGAAREACEAFAALEVALDGAWRRGLAGPD